MSWCSRQGRCPNTRTSPHGLVLVFETRETERGGARAPERARVGTFWCSRRGKRRGEAPEHQNVPVWARSGVQDKRYRRGRARTPERAHTGAFWCSREGEREHQK